MSDLISRQAAIARAVPLNLFGREVMMVSVSELENLPSAQPEKQHGRIFQGIIVEYPTISTYPGYEGKPYFSIKYTENGQEFIGYGTYKPEVLSEYLKEYFMPSAQPDIARDIATIIENEQDMRVVLKNAEHTETHDWILCSERMPEEHEWMGTKRFGTTISDEVYVTFENPKGERFCKHLSFQNGKLSDFDQSTIDAFYKGSKPIAWMPLPKPYAERRQDGTRD